MQRFAQHRISVRFHSAYLDWVRQWLEPEIGAATRLVRTSGACYKDIREEDHREP